MSTTMNQAANSLNIFEQIGANNHEQVVFCNDPASGLKSIIAIHNTTCGPALGGTRFWNYANDAEALRDVLRLSRGMTYKAAISGLNLGGGKAVIIGNSYTDKSEALWRRYGKFVNGLAGRYITAEDVGTAKEDMEYIAMETKHVTGVPEYMGGSGDPSPVTAYTTYLGMKASAKKVFGNDSLSGKVVAVQGAGHVAQYLIGHLVKDGAIVHVCDINNDKVAAVVKEHGVKVVDADAIYDLKMDIYSPCAMGATVNDATLKRLTCSIIAGCANNQLEDEKIHGQQVKDMGIVYAPDFLINAGGLINVATEREGYNRERAMGKAEQVYKRTLDIFAKADAENLTNQAAAILIAEQRIKQLAKLKSSL
ncbi:MAG: Glu/Leu/Phe/Val dehydrogenase [Chitinophagales bacterium]|nr:Glu/Leu/Phe/Val dehydrogenase [Chitinophagales bacterium]